MLRFDGFGLSLSLSDSRLSPATELRSYAGLRAKSPYSCFPLADFICGRRIVYYTSTVIVKCNSRAVLVFVIRRTLHQLLSSIAGDMSAPQGLPGHIYYEQWRCLGLICAHIYEGEDAISEDDSSVGVGLSENSTFTEIMVHRTLHQPIPPDPWRKIKCLLPQCWSKHGNERL